VSRHQRNNLEIYLDVLRALQRYPQGLAPTRLASISNLNLTQDLHKVLESLLRNGLVMRVPTSKRRVCLRVTVKGLKWIRDAEAVLAPLYVSAEKRQI
jgi:predicted transcriptional regulator